MINVYNNNLPGACTCVRYQLQEVYYKTDKIGKETNKGTVASTCRVVYRPRLQTDSSLDIHPYMTHAKTHMTNGCINPRMMYRQCPDTGMLLALLHLASASASCPAVICCAGD